MAVELRPRVWTDSTAAVGIPSRAGQVLTFASAINSVAEVHDEEKTPSHDLSVLLHVYNDSQKD